MRETEHTFRLVFFLFFCPKLNMKSVSQKAETEYTISFFFLSFFLLKWILCNPFWFFLMHHSVTPFVMHHSVTPERPSGGH